jgi:cellulose synthase/poly-beta-1,6-N-acetylglucosamine synthase-like glycosyltransferase
LPFSHSSNRSRIPRGVAVSPVGMLPAVPACMCAAERSEGNSPMQIVFWGSVFLVLYPFIVYPVLVSLWGRVFPRPVRRAPIEPTVTVLIPAYNEADVIANTLEAMLAQDYPAGKMDILVVSDGSSDGTDEIVAGFASRGVRLLRQEGRGGKALALNAAVRQATGEIIVFCDANAQFAPQAVRTMVRNFADPQVGYATGSLRLLSAEPTLAGSGISSYMRYENHLREAETRVGSVIGVNGGCDAVRRSLYSDIPGHLITDFVLPLRVIASGSRVVYDPDAISSEVANDQLKSEFGMRVRVALRALQGLTHMRRLFNPLRFPGVAFCLVSHKVVRYVAFVFLVTALLSNIWLALWSPFYTVLLVAHFACYALALCGVAGVGHGRLKKLTVVPAYLLVSYSAFALAMFRFLRGQSMATWRPRAG